MPLRGISLKNTLYGATFFVMRNLDVCYHSFLTGLQDKSKIINPLYVKFI